MRPLEVVGLSVVSANVLAPIYKRMDSNGTREANFEDLYLPRCVPHTQPPKTLHVSYLQLA